MITPRERNLSRHNLSSDYYEDVGSSLGYFRAFLNAVSTLSLPSRAMKPFTTTETPLDRHLSSEQYRE